MHKHPFKNPVTYFAHNISTVVALVLIWRGIWYTADWLDQYLFGSSHVLSSIGGIAAGLIILFAPDHNLKEIEKL